jgi:hypothetical protein
MGMGILFCSRIVRREIGTYMVAHLALRREEGKDFK